MIFDPEKYQLALAVIVREGERSSHHDICVDEDWMPRFRGA
jgi:hypothetical protein